MSRAADRRVVEYLLRECTKDPRQPTGWFPGGRVTILDLETTGLDRQHDRIVEAAWLLADRRALAWDSILINPGIPIPHDSYDIHGLDVVSYGEGRSDCGRLRGDPPGCVGVGLVAVA
ncbi:hypothetical protein ACGFU4_12725, partial [Streptomyces sp. NPDC048511]